MERKKDGKNILIGGLVAIILLMAVGFALAAQALDITATGTVSNNFAVKFEDGPITAASKSTGTTSELSIAADKLSANLTASFTSAGDYVEYNIQVLNTGNLDAYLKAITLVSTATTPAVNDENIKFTYTLKNTSGGEIYTKGHMSGETAAVVDTSFTPVATTSTINKYNGVNYLTIRLEYVAETQSAGGSSAGYKLTLNYEQVS